MSTHGWAVNKKQVRLSQAFSIKFLTGCAHGVKIPKVSVIYAELSECEALIAYWFFTSHQSSTGAVRRMRKLLSSKPGRNFRKIWTGGSHERVS